MGGWSFTSAAIDGYIDDPRSTPGFKRAVTLLDAFRRGQLRTSDVFDCDKLATEMLNVILDVAGKQLIGDTYIMSAV